MTTTDAAQVPYEETAHGKWAALHPKGRDYPRLSIWFPSETPSARLQTRAGGCQEPDTLPPGPPIAYLTISGVEFGGYLEELELLLAAAGDSLRWVREQYEQMVADGRAADV